jgi:uncharacterized protein YdbL (DUF1318 family)
MKFFRLSLFLFSAWFFVTSSVSAADLGQVKNEMKARQPAIESLWAEGRIGENNQGFIEARGTLSAPQSQMVQAENADRRVVYQAIARSTQTTPATVGRQRAAQISMRAANGLWLQDASGEWYRK